MNTIYFLISLPYNRRIPIAIDESKLHGAASVMWEAEQQGLLTYEECNVECWEVSRISESQYKDIIKVVFTLALIV